MSPDETVNAWLADALGQSHAWSGRPGDADLAGLPGCAAVYLLVDQHGAPVQLATTQQLKRLSLARLGESESPGGRTDLAEIVRGIRWRQVHSKFEARWWYYRAARRLYPRDYRKQIGFGPSWFLNVDWKAAVPELRVSERIWVKPGEFIGPWPTQKSCRKALDGLWDLFDLCRYPEQVRRAPQGVRCAYAEMGRCDAPCDGSVPLDAYLERTRAAWRFAGGAIAPWKDEAEVRMREASAALGFERAALVKSQLAFASVWQRDWQARVRADCDLDDLLLIPVVRRKAWKVFAFLRGHLLDGPVLRDKQIADAAAWFEEACARPHATLEPIERMEQTWLYGHFLHHRERAAAIVLPCGSSSDRKQLSERIQDALTVRREVTGAPGN